jgi:hypothetical protein
MKRRLGIAKSKDEASSSDVCRRANTHRQQRFHERHLAHNCENLLYSKQISIPYSSRSKGAVMRNEAKGSYDVFISYSHNDSDWVRGYLIPILVSWGLQVAIDNRVFVPGVSLDDHIQNTIHSSKQVIFVCTQHFVASTWCLKEVEMTLERKSINCIPLVLDGPNNVPKALGNITWADLTDLQHDENEWRKLCKSLNGKWSPRTDEILKDLQDLISFFGGFMNNKTTTYVVQRSHNVIHGKDKVDHMITVPSIEALSVAYLMLGRIQKTQNVHVILSNDKSELSTDISNASDNNFVVLGGSRPDLVTHFSGRDFDKFYWDNELPLGNGEIKKVDWEKEKWGYIIYKSRSSVGGMVIFLYSPSGIGTKMAAETLLNNYWEFAREKKGREFFQAYDYSGQLLYEHEYTE